MAQPQDAFKDKKNIMWVLLSGAMALTIVILLFLPISGTGGSLFSVYSAMLWCGIFGATLARYIGKSGWFGFAIGSVSGMVIQIIASLL